MSDYRLPNVRQYLSSIVLLLFPCFAVMCGETSAKASQQLPKVRIERASNFEGRQLLLSGQLIGVSVSIPKQRSADSKLWLELRRGRQTTFRKRLKQSRTGRTRRQIYVRLRKAGRFRIVVRQGSLRRSRIHRFSTVEVIEGNLRFGRRGIAVRFLQQRLSALGYVNSRSGQYDAATGRAVLAYRKVRGLKRVETVDRPVLSGIANGRGRFHPRFAKHGRHVEADLSRQVITLIDRGGQVRRIYTTSSGKASTPTVRGHFRFYMKTPGTNAKGMVDPSFFIRGYAVHGYISVPAYAASHGCLRVPIPVARSIYDWIHVGDRIDVYG